MFLRIVRNTVQVKDLTAWHIVPRKFYQDSVLLTFLADNVPKRTKAHNNVEIRTSKTW